MDRADILIIGGGVVGLAIAAELAGHCQDGSVVLLERHAKFGQETSSRNSEVIHAGIYYPRASLKARLCVEGNRRMYDFCARWNIPCARMGKLIVANTADELKSLEALMTAGTCNGVSDLQMLDRAQAKRLEPEVRALAAIFSPSTGIVDSHRLMARLELLARDGHAIIAYNHEVIGIDRTGERYTVLYQTPAGERQAIASRWVINCAGLASDAIASLAGIDRDTAGYRLFPCKGEYFRLPYAKSKQLSHLIYPPPFKDLRGLGIHVTLSLDGMARLGPNAFYGEQLDYTVDPAHAADFYAGASQFLPFLEPDDLEPDMAGIRPKLQAPGTPVRDFVVCHEKERGLPGLINLIGIESPGLTACLSLAAMVKDLIRAEE
jgi:L-2-hydroxyglutarate oxidase LhgO